MQGSIAFLALVLAVGVANAVLGLVTTPEQSRSKFEIAWLRGRLRLQQLEMKELARAKPKGAASILSGTMIREPYHRMPTLMRQTELPIAGDGVYKTCRTNQELQLIDESLPCLGCLLVDEACPTYCCASFTTPGDDANQAILCEVGKCCIRIMVDLDGDAVVYSNEPLMAMSRARGDNTCRTWKASNTCRVCSVVTPDFEEVETLTCPYEMPKYKTLWDPVVECSTQSESSSSEDASTSSNEDDAEVVESTVVPSVTFDDVRCRCKCASGSR